MAKKRPKLHTGVYRGPGSVFLRQTLSGVGEVTEATGAASINLFGMGLGIVHNTLATVTGGKTKPLTDFMTSKTSRMKKTSKETYAVIPDEYKKTSKKSSPEPSSSIDPQYGSPYFSPIHAPRNYYPEPLVSMNQPRPKPSAPTRGDMSTPTSRKTTAARSAGLAAGRAASSAGSTPPPHAMVIVQRTRPRQQPQIMKVTQTTINNQVGRLKPSPPSFNQLAEQIFNLQNWESNRPEPILKVRKGKASMGGRGGRLPRAGGN